MPNMTPYPTSKTTPSRKARKGERIRIFLANKNAAKKVRQARKAAEEAALEAQEQEGTEE